MYFTGYDDDIDSNVYLLRLNAEGRWYPQENSVRGWFVNGGVQFLRLSASITADDETAGGGINTLGICVGGGYKFVFGKERAGFVLEPSLDFTVPVWSDLMEMWNIPFVGWLLGGKGFRGGLMFGIAF